MEWQKHWFYFVGASAILFVWVLLLLSVDQDKPPEIVLFLGSFHPLLVHLPIGILLLAALLEGISHRYKRFEPATALILLVGAASAVIAATAGFLLSLERGYEGSVIEWHMWLGISVAGGAVAASILKLLAQKIPLPPVVNRIYSILLVGTIALLTASGHLGATLARGSDHLTRYMPESLKNLMGLTAGSSRRPQRIVNINEALIFDDLVSPILQERCVSCHNESKKKGELRLDTLKACSKEAAPLR